MAGNTSPRGDNTMLTVASRFYAGTTYEVLLFPADLGPKPQIRPLHSLVPTVSSNNLASPGRQEHVQDHNSAPCNKEKGSQGRDNTSLPGLRLQQIPTEEPEEEFLGILHAYYATIKRTNQNYEEPCPNAGQTATLPPAKEPEKKLVLHQGSMTVMSSIHSEPSKGSRRTPAPVTTHPKDEAKHQGFGSQLPGSRLRS
ncbi:Uncharacterized protein Rs2_49445 [Raphanus sativus]|nr:Uncharacterized protein Rs2_49445 [Raphanus sativus]